MNRDELTLLKEYVKTLEGQNESKNKERSSLLRQLDALQNENNQLKLGRPMGDTQLVIEKNREIAALTKELQVLRSERNSNSDGKQFVSDIAMLKQELDNLQQEIVKTKREFKTKEDSWESERRSLINENSQLKTAVSGTDIRGEFDKLRNAYSRLEIELNNKISQLQGSNRALESEKNRLQLERDNHKQERERLTLRVSELERQQNNRISTPYMTPDNSERISQLNTIINDLNNQLLQVTRQRDSLKASKSESERVVELTSLIQELNGDRNRMRSEFDALRGDRDRLANRIGEFERQKAGLLQQINRLNNGANSRLSSSPSKENDWLKEKSQLLLEISNLKNEKHSAGWVVDGHNRRIDELQRENNLLKGQYQANEQQVIEYRRKEELVRKEIHQIGGELARLSEIKKHTDDELLRYKGEIAKLVNANAALQNELNMLRQTAHNQQAGQSARLIETIKQLERRVYVLESANYNLSEELNRNLQHSKTSPSFDHIIQAMKAELLEMKVENEKLVQINQDLMMDYRQCSEQLRIERENRDRIAGGRSQLIRHTSPSPPAIQNIENQQQYSRLEYVQQPPSPSRSAGVFQQRWQDNDPKRPHHKLYRAHEIPPTTVADTSKWSNLQRKINALKQQNDQLKRNLHLPC